MSAKIKSRSVKPEGTSCVKCERGKLIYPNKWWRDELKQLRCNWCHATYRVVGPSPILNQGSGAIP